MPKQICPIHHVPFECPSCRAARGAAATRQRFGVQTMRAWGSTGGRPPKLSKEQVEKAYRLQQEKHLTLEQLAGRFSVSRSAMSAALKRRKGIKDGNTAGRTQRAKAN